MSSGILCISLEGPGPLLRLEPGLFKIGDRKTHGIVLEDEDGLSAGFRCGVAAAQRAAFPLTQPR